jgi:hypothetical protein
MVGGGWSAADIAGLEPHHAILLAVAGGRMQPAVPIRVAFWSYDLRRFAAEQSYANASSVAELPVPSATPPIVVAPGLAVTAGPAEPGIVHDPYSTGE